MRCPEAEVLTGTAEEIPLPDASIDAVFVAQAFHNFSDEPALAEIARELRPGEWGFALAESAFEPLRAARIPNPQTVDRDGLVAFFASMGWIADLPDLERLPLLEEVRSLLADAEYERPWETHVRWTRLAA
jgi:SAM-dependent methyltransferase